MNDPRPRPPIVITAICRCGDTTRNASGVCTRCKSAAAAPEDPATRQLWLWCETLASLLRQMPEGAEAGRWDEEERKP